MQGLIDSHAHLTYPGLIERIDEVVENARRAGVVRILTIGTQLADARRAIDLSKRFGDMISAACAIHPHHAGEVDDAALEELAAIWRSGEVVALGEMGLDYHYDFADRTVQRRVFGRQLEHAKEHDRAIIIHCREAFSDVEPMLLDHGFAGRRVVFHCFTGTAEEADAIASRGWRISFTGIVTFKKSAWLHDIARRYPSELLMVETDSPYLSPEPVRGRQPNEPAHVAYVAQFLARLRGVEEQQLVDETAANTRAFFGL